jgi:hypothetical protein
MASSGRAAFLADGPLSPGQGGARIKESRANYFNGDQLVVERDLQQVLAMASSDRRHVGVPAKSPQAALTCAFRPACCGNGF